jgi:hypothetical protein
MQTDKPGLSPVSAEQPHAASTLPVPTAHAVRALPTPGSAIGAASYLNSVSLDKLVSAVAPQHIRDVVDVSLAVDWKPSKSRVVGPAETKRAVERSLAEFKEKVCAYWGDVSMAGDCNPHNDV